MKIKSFCEKRHGGFTLMELLIVITIVAILAALLMPVTAGVVEEGRATKCLSNMRQALAGRKLYAADNDNRTIPIRPAWPADPNGLCTWRYYLNQKYNVDAKVFLCPSAPSKAKEEGGEAWRTAKSDVDSNFAQLGNSPWNMSRPVASTQTPSQQLELIETRDHWPDLQIFNWQTTWGDGFGVYGYWHKYRMSCGYADGHVERKKLGETVTPVCQWDTDEGVHDGAITHGGDYRSMPKYYKTVTK